MHKLITAAALTCALPLIGCATSSDPITKVGPDTYTVGAAGRFADYSNSAIKSKLYEEAYKHCGAQNRIMAPVDAGQTSSNNPPEMQFRCVARNEAQLNKPTL